MMREFERIKIGLTSRKLPKRLSKASVTRRVSSTNADSRASVSFINVWKLSSSSKTLFSLKDASFSVESGSCLGVLGASGAGKSALLRMMVGLERHYRGDVVVKPNVGPSDSLREVSPGLSFCSQTLGLMPLLTVRETLVLFGRLRGLGSNAIQYNMSVLLDLLALTPNADNYCRILNETDQRKARLCAALIGNPSIIVLDEPCEGLSHLEIRALRQLLIRHRQLGGTVVMATENAELCETMCTHVVILRDGEATEIKMLNYFSDPAMESSRFCKGYIVEVIFSTGPKDRPVRDPKEFFVDLVGRHSTVQVFTDNQKGAWILFSGKEDDLAKIFALMEDGKNYYGISEYTVTKAGLQHVLANTYTTQE